MAKILLAFICYLAGVLAMREHKMIDTMEDDIDNRIVGGQTAAIGAFPHQVSLRRYGRHFCGGSIIDATTVLTAAHCIYGLTNPSSVTVVAGTNSRTFGGQTYRVTKTIYHEKYNNSLILNDIAIIKLASPIKFSNLVKPILLANYEVAAMQKLKLSGWGLTSFPSQTLPDDLKFIELNAIDTQTCKSLHRNRLPITSSQLCTLMGPGKGACKGDSGGPLIDDKGVQVGIVSWGKPCAKNVPDVFTKVSQYRDWIKNNSV